ncbi:MAG: hypothetical protein LBM75_08415 [Myxococcales bacterium]|jgi:hypothetical protein|nr:hypothetical protein [Myxococcales bacterium]
MFQTFTMKPFALAALASLGLVLLPAPGHAASIFINGTKVDGVLANYKLTKCSASFDARGDLFLDCPGYNLSVEMDDAPVSRAAQAATPPPASGPASSADRTPSAPQPMPLPAKLSAQYVLFTSQSQVGATGFDVDVFINGVLAVRLKNEDVQAVEDVTRYLRQGENAVTFVARKKPSVRQIKALPNDFFEIQITEGSIDPATDSLIIKAGTGIKHRVTASEALDSTREFQLNVR